MNKKATTLRIGFAGTPEFAAVALSVLIGSEHEVVVVLSQPDRPAGRGRKLQASAVKETAINAGLAVWQPVKLSDEQAQQQLASYELDVLVVVAYGLLLPESILSTPRLGCLNIHASLLPRWRGAAPIQRAILAGDKQTGICIMQMDAGLDTGAVLTRRETPIGVNMIAGELHDDLAQLGAQALLETLTGLSNESITAVPQSEEGVCYAHKLQKSEAMLDFDKPAVQLHRQVMAFNPWPVAQTQLDNQQLRVWRSALPDVESQTDADPGTVIEVSKSGVVVATAEGTIQLLQLQRSGKKTANAADVGRALQLVGRVLG
jgi:methionyl-tRNA formyltransferase